MNAVLNILVIISSGLLGFAGLLRNLRMAHDSRHEGKKGICPNIEGGAHGV
jgi:Tfp pilus assembly protein PilV